MTPLEIYFGQNFPVSGAQSPYVVQSKRKGICKAFAALGYRTGAEIGVWQGSFSKDLCELNPGVQLTCVDPWRQYG